MADEVVLPIPNLTVPQNLFVLSNPALKHLHENARKDLLAAIKEDQMAPYYKSITASSSVLPLDKAFLAQMEKANEEELAKLDERLAEAQKIEGESEISDALKARANYLTRIGDKEKSLEAQNLALEKTPGLGSRIDIVLTIVRIGFFFSDTDVVTKNMAKAENIQRSSSSLHPTIKRGGELLLDALSTFTATELLSYNDFVALTVISNTLTLKRVDLKKKIIAAPEVNQVLPEIPVLGDLVKNLYECHYDKFFVASLLESYRSLTVESLAGAFGVSVEFVDSELSRFIANGRLHASIDKVHGIVETTRPSLKNAQYEQVIKQGDVLLNEVQRLSKVLY
ncbi:hypothetical protein D9613_013025 [Agrocybe pediades]|uniref:PCI domain-containing protein n=1 Tax=Agrocybe pediades TaxID=84607 RepID=A0A8H4QKB6_9AGAR|nr:hypothetical protein D9613_013025 [Agrocybe pediades]